MTLVHLIALVLVLVVVGIVLQSVAIEPRIKTVIVVLIAVVTFVLLLGLLGLVPGVRVVHT